MRQLFQTLTLAVLVGLVVFVVYQKKHNQIVTPPISPRVGPPVVDTPPPSQPPTETYPLPTFVDFPAVRQANKGGKILSDIISHLPAGNIYEDADLATSGHESTHGINSAIRQKFQGMDGYYCLENRAVTLKKPPLRLTTVAQSVPRALRGDVYKLYFVDQVRYWDDDALYCLDEFDAYTHGTMVGIENNLNRGESGQYMAEFAVYALCLAKATHSANSEIHQTGMVIVPPTIVEKEKSRVVEGPKGPEIMHPTASEPEFHEGEVVTAQYDDQSFKAYLRWQIERVAGVIQQTQGTNMQSAKAAQVLNTLRASTDPDVAALREFTKSYLSPSWTQRVLGF
jgi:hypothetical protein